MTYEELRERDNRAALATGRPRTFEARVGGLPVTVPGVQCLLTGDTLATPSGGQLTDGAMTQALTLHCITADLPFRPVASQLLTIDGVTHIVLSSRDDDGMLTVKLQEEIV